MDLDIGSEVSLAFKFAEDSPFPDAASAYTDLYDIESPEAVSQPQGMGA